LYVKKKKQKQKLILTELSDHSFLTQINRYDIVLLSETHIGYDTAVESDKFYYYPFCRQKSNNNRYFGGLTILIDNRIVII
jgi:hypothetical protein